MSRDHTEQLRLTETELREANRSITMEHAIDTSDLTPDVLFIDDVAKVLRTSRSTIERRRRNGTFPVPELPRFDGRPRWSRQSVERFLNSTRNGELRRRGPGRQR